ncbi:MAG: c-type cytochrome [Acidobacteriaceae bacterium]|nr:c-type cytochrome [Acidobacteriaceae bacterium]MBV9778649.1 c-type cytochrome [Acidobacteriaceae bacterium]
MSNIIPHDGLPWDPPFWNGVVRLKPGLPGWEEMEISMIRRVSGIAELVLASAGTLAMLCFAGAPLASSAANQQGKTAHGDASKGKTAFEQCAVCHDVDTGEKKMGPSLKGLFKRSKLANGKAVTEANVLEQINSGGNGMPAYADILSADDKANLLAYLKTI